MPPKRSTRSARPVQRSPEPAPVDLPGLQDGQHGGRLPAKKKPTVAENAKAIQAMQADLSSMTGLLTTLTHRLCPASTPESPRQVPEADPANYAPRGRPLERHPDPQRTWSAPRPDSPCRDRHPSAPPVASPRPQAARSSQWPGRESMFLPREGSSNISDIDPLIARPGFRPYRDFPSSLQGLEEDPDLSNRVATLLSASIMPLAHTTGKKCCAHSFIARGNKRTRTTLGDLSIPECTTGFIRMINHQDTPIANKPFMFKHLEHINEDAIIYEWPDVRAWSEEMCTLVAEGTLRWSDEYRIDIMRLKLSQRHPKHDASAYSAATKEKKDAMQGDKLTTSEQQNPALLVSILTQGLALTPVTM